MCRDETSRTASISLVESCPPKNRNKRAVTEKEIIEYSKNYIYLLKNMQGKGYSMRRRRNKRSKDGRRIDEPAPQPSSPQSSSRSASSFSMPKHEINILYTEKTCERWRCGADKGEIETKIKGGQSREDGNVNGTSAAARRTLSLKYP